MVIDLTPVFMFYKTDGLFWFRVYGGYGFHGKNITKRPLMFSDKSRKTKRYKIGNWLFKTLKP